MAEKLKELRSLPLEKLIEKHDKLASFTEVGTKHYLDEIHRRDSEKETKTIVSLTKWITVMTEIMMIATIINIVLFVLK